ncbi:MAG: TetR/AcrR family transcriptional regulator [Pseudomonadota bacterium]
MTDPKDRFLNAAQKLFSARGLHGVSLADVAGDMAVSKQAILYHFKTKDRLFAAVLAQVGARLAAVLSDVASREVDDTERVPLLIRALYAHLQDHPDDARLIARELADNPGRVEQAKALPLNDFLDGCVTVLAAHPATQAVPRPRIRAATYQLVGAMTFYVISAPTLGAMWGDDGLKAVDEAFLPVLLEAWGAA